MILAFNRAAKEEIQERLQNKIGVKCDTHTFHSFGLEVIAKSKQKKPSIAKFVENDTEYKEEINKIIIKACKEKVYGNIMAFFASYLLPYTAMSLYKVIGDYYKSIKKNKKSLSGIYVRSLEELEIADLLTLFSVNFEYEQNYKYDTATYEYRQYQPDFYLPDYDIYIEHFAINRDGTSIFGEEYVKSIDWKRKIHIEYNTIMIETYSFMKSDGILSDYLISQLKKNNVILTPIPRDQFIQQSSDNITRFAHLCASFLNLFKSSHSNFEKMLCKTDENKHDTYYTKRSKTFLSIFEYIYNEYELLLKANNVIDFNDMINKAVDTISLGDWHGKYKFIIIDEFQDISVARAALIQALQKVLPEVKLFCVGDDWQSIYRFAGSDISVMTNFNDYFGYNVRIDLTRTFRFNDKIAYVSSKFIQKNPNQLKKEVSSLFKNTNHGIVLFIPDETSGRYLENFAEEISKEANHSQTDVLILGRYNFLEKNVAYQELKKVAPQCNFKFRTVHSAKGLEADYVIIIGVSSESVYGFPSERVDDPILDLVLARNENYQFAEERRLFYVALTRAKKKVFLVAPQEEISPFFSELADEYNSYFVEQRNIIIANRYCPICITGIALLRNGKDSSFYGCSNFPNCTFTSEACPACAVGYFANSNDGYYTCDKCGKQAQLCPRCRKGFLIQKSGQFGLFYGCSNYRLTGCSFTKNIS